MKESVREKLRKRENGNEKHGGGRCERKKNESE